MDGDLDRLAFIIASVYKNELLPSEEFVDIVADDLELIRETIEEVSELQPRFPWIPGEITLTFNKKPEANPKANNNNEGNSNDNDNAVAADVNGEKNEKGENEKNDNIDSDSPFVKYREGKIPELKEADDKYGIVATHTIESLQQMHLKFSKPYDSQQLANEYFNLLSNKNKIDNNNNDNDNNIIKSSEPNMMPGDGDHLTIEFVIEPDEDEDDDDKDEKQKQPAAATEGSNEEENYPDDDDDDDGIISNSGGTRQYCFSKGWGKDDGPNGCVHRHTWKIAVIDDQVKMIDEYGTTIRDENDVCFGSSGGCNIM